MAHPGEVLLHGRQRAKAEEVLLREQFGRSGADRGHQDHHQAEHQFADPVLPQERKAQQPHAKY